MLITLNNSRGLQESQYLLIGEQEINVNTEDAANAHRGFSPVDNLG